MNPHINVGIVGATGVVGEVFQQLLLERQFPVKKLKLFASDRSLGQVRKFHGEAVAIETLSEGCFADLDLVFFSSGDDISREWGPRAVQEGAVVVDNSAAFRLQKEQLLIVPEVNGNQLPQSPSPILIANPNCSTIQLVLALAPLHKTFGLESVHVASYQAVSGAGRAGQDELGHQLKSWAEGVAHSSPETFPHPIAMNCIPQIGSFHSNGFCSEELKIMQETKKILADTSIRVSAFTVRVPAWNAHSEAVWVRLKKPVDEAAVLKALHGQEGLIVEDNPKDSIYPLALRWSEKDPVAVGRIHRDLDDPQTWLMWIVGDNLRKGAALNGIQIAEKIFATRLHAK